MGLVTAGTTTFYYLSLLFIPASVAITLLFQFTWIGLVFEVATTRRQPTNAALLAAVVVCVGTLFASGLLGGARHGGAAPAGHRLRAGGRGVLRRLHVPFGTRGDAGARAAAGAVGLLRLRGGGLRAVPDYLSSGVLARGIGWYGLGPGAARGFAVPRSLFGMACKHLSPGLSTIMASSELPISVLCSVLLLHEAVTPLQVAGVAAILAGVVVAQVPPLRRRS